VQLAVVSSLSFGSTMSRVFLHGLGEQALSFFGFIVADGVRRPAGYRGTPIVVGGRQARDSRRTSITSRMA